MTALGWPPWRTLDLLYCGRDRFGNLFVFCGCKGLLLLLLLLLLLILSIGLTDNISYWCYTAVGDFHAVISEEECLDSPCDSPNDRSHFLGKVVQQRLERVIEDLRALLGERLDIVVVDLAEVFCALRVHQMQHRLGKPNGPRYFWREALGALTGRVYCLFQLCGQRPKG